MVDINARKNKIFSAKNSLFLTDLSSKWWRIYASVELYPIRGSFVIYICTYKRDPEKYGSVYAPPLAT